MSGRAIGGTLGPERALLLLVISFAACGVATYTKLLIGSLIELEQSEL